MPTPTGYWNAEEAETQHDFSEALAEWIRNYLPKDKTVIDFGCGNGKYVAYLSEFDITGIEGDGITVTETNNFTEQDLTIPFLNPCDSAICLEVGEHIPADYAGEFINNLTNNVKDKIILSWAVPGQEGYYHVNCQSNLWVINQMAKRGFKLLPADTFDARNATEERFNYFKNTILIFQREMKTLDEIGSKFLTDKSSMHHDYCKIYEQYLAPFRERRISLIEVGAGGYEFEDRGGESLRMWYEYFRNGKIIGIDFYKKSGLINDRTEFWQGSQDDEHLLKTIIDREVNAEQRIFIDDASHINELTIKTFQIAFPLLSSGDIYIAEDVHTSYWENWFSGNPIPGAKNTTMGYFTFLTHQLNAHVLQEEFKNEFADMIEYVHFYRELVIIKRK